MNKLQYLIPEAEVMLIEPASVICESVITRGAQTSSFSKITVDDDDWEMD